MPEIIDLTGDDDDVVEVPPPGGRPAAPVIDLTNDSDSSCSCSSCNDTSDDDEGEEAAAPAPPPAHTFLASHPLGPGPLLITPTTPPGLGTLILRYMLRCLLEGRLN